MTPDIILSLVVALCTIAYTWINYLLWQESIKTRKQMSSPHLIAYIKMREDYRGIEFIIENIGNGVAKEVKVTMLEDYNIVPHYSISSMGIIKDGFQSFPPKYKLQCFLGTIPDMYEEKSDSFIKLEITYSYFFDKHNISCSEVFCLSLASIKNQLYIV